MDDYITIKRKKFNVGQHEICAGIYAKMTSEGRFLIDGWPCESHALVDSDAGYAPVSISDARENMDYHGYNPLSEKLSDSEIKDIQIAVHEYMMENAGD